jgi:hypothetical protein
MPIRQPPNILDGAQTLSNPERCKVSGREDEAVELSGVEPEVPCDDETPVGRLMREERLQSLDGDLMLHWSEPHPANPSFIQIVQV